MATSTQKTTTPDQTGPSNESGNESGSGGLESGKVVAYIGSADIREIDSKAWDNVGVKDQKKTVWNAGNKWMVPVSDLTDAAVAYCSDDDEGFAVRDAPVDK